MSLGKTQPDECPWSASKENVSGGIVDHESRELKGVIGLQPVITNNTIDFDKTHDLRSTKHHFT